MVRRPKVNRTTSGDPVWADRCKWMVADDGGLFDKRVCKRARKRGYQYCAVHVEMEGMR